MTNTMTRPLPHQMRNLRDLLAEIKSLDTVDVYEGFRSDLNTLKDSGELTDVVAEKWIQDLTDWVNFLNTPKPITEDGMYMKNGFVFKVQMSSNGRLYAKELCYDSATDKWVFDYAPGVVRTLTADHKMTLDQAKEFGALYGTCAVCGRTLTNEESITLGIGPICRGKF